MPKLIAEFKDVFTEENLPPMTGQPMHIHMHSDAKPIKHITARQIPIHLARAAQEEIDIHFPPLYSINFFSSLFL